MRINPLHVNGWTIREYDGGFAVTDSNSHRWERTLKDAVTWAQRNPHAGVTHPGPNDPVREAQERIRELSGSMAPGADVHRRLLLRLVTRINQIENTPVRGCKGWRA